MVCVGSPDRIHQLSKLTLRDDPLGPLPHSALNKFPNSYQALRAIAYVKQAAEQRHFTWAT